MRSILLNQKLLLLLSFVLVACLHIFSMEKKSIRITKASGEQVEFSEEKLRHSLLRSGAASTTIDLILKQVQQLLFPGISTHKIYKLAFDLLKKESKHFAARYKLKSAIMELGPSGFPFEKFISELLRHKGYQVQVGVVVQGRCVTHEIDVIAERDDEYIMVECKYHNLQGVSCDVKIPLYIDARFRDVNFIWEQQKEHTGMHRKGWLVTNTKFTEDAVQYGTCAGLNLIGWNFPAKNNLKILIDESGLYPLTCLSSLTKSEKQSLLDQKIVLCKELRDNEKLLSDLHITEIRKRSILDEIHHLTFTIQQNQR